MLMVPRDIAAPWFWARVHLRSSSLGHLRGGFQQLYNALVAEIERLGGETHGGILSSFEAARHIKKTRPETKVLFLTMYEDEDYLVQCLEVGASGYVLKDTPAPQLVSAVRDVYKGGKYLSSQVLGKLVEDFRSRVRDQKMRPRISTLTPREREILKLLAEGNSVKEIAVLLGLSVKTVEAHKFNLMRKLDIHNKAQLVTYAIQKSIIKIPVNQ